MLSSQSQMTGSLVVWSRVAIGREKRPWWHLLGLQDDGSW